MFLNSASIYWFSKKQISVETSSIGAEFIVLKQCCEYVRGLRFKLQMMDIAVDIPTLLLGDNQSVLTNVTVPHSTLKKKSSSAAYHFFHTSIFYNGSKVSIRSFRLPHDIGVIADFPCRLPAFIMRL